MENEPPIDTLLENYILHIAAKYIAVISQENQTRLINLVNKVGKSPDAGSLSNQLLERADKPLVKSPFNELEQQWQEALVSPGPLQEESNSTESSKLIFRRSLLLNQREIETTLSCIERMNELIAQAETKHPMANYQNRLVQHYRTIQAGFTTRLEQLESFQERKVRSLCP